MHYWNQLDEIIGLWFCILFLSCFSGIAEFAHQFLSEEAEGRHRPASSKAEEGLGGGHFLQLDERRTKCWKWNQ